MYGGGGGWGGGTTLRRPVSGEKQKSSGILEICRESGDSGNFVGNMT